MLVARAAKHRAVGAQLWLRLRRGGAAKPRAAKALEKALEMNAKQTQL